MADASIPKKYWWVVALLLPIVLALIAVWPQLRKSSGGSGGTTTTITGGTNTIVYGTNNTFITNVNIFVQEYERQTGRPIGEDLRKQIEAAVAAGQQGNHAESIRLFEQIAKAAPIPAVYNNLGVEYAQTKNAEASQRAFQLSKEKLAELTSATTTSDKLPDSAVRPPKVTGPGIRTEASGLTAIEIEAMSAPYEAPSGIEVIAPGTFGSFYSVTSRPKPGVPAVLKPGAYDVLVKTGSSNAAFVVASNVDVKEGTLTRINLNALVGGVALEPGTRQGFPVIKDLQFVKDRFVAQHTEKLGVTLPLAPGSYQMIVHAAGDQYVRIPDAITVSEGAISRLDVFTHVAAVVVHAPRVTGLEMKAVDVVGAGTNQIAAKATAWEVPMLVRAGVTYEVILEQEAGPAPVYKPFTPKPGELVEIRLDNK